MTVEKAGEMYLQLTIASNAAREAWMRAPRPTVANLAEHKQRKALGLPEPSAVSGASPRQPSRPPGLAPAASW